MPGKSRHYDSILEGRHPGVVSIMAFFAWGHLPPNLMTPSRLVSEVAWEMVDNIPDSPELVAGLRKLLESKDCFVRATLEKAGDWRSHD